MRKHGWYLAAAALAACCTLGSAARAQSTETDDLRARIAELERNIALLESGGSHYASYYLDEGKKSEHGHEEDEVADLAASGCGGCSNDCCCGPCEWIGPEFYTNRCRSCGVVAGAEIVFLKPHFSEDFSTNANVQYDFEPSYRYWLGWQMDSGLGARLRYWEIDRGNSFNNAEIGVEFRTLDLELTQGVEFRRWSLLLSGGIRYGETSDRLNIFDDGFDGTGLTTSLTAARDLTSGGGLRLVTTGRWSLLFGNSKRFVNGAVFDVDRDDLVNVLEVQVGPQIRRPLSSGAFLTLGAGFEGQYWSNPMGFDTNDYGFVGFGTNMGIAR